MMMEEMPVADRPGKQQQWRILSGGRRLGPRYLIVALAAALLSAVAVLSWYWRHRPVPTPVQFVMVKERDIVASVTATGQVEAMRELDATATIAGIVRQVLVEEGDRVRQGQAVAVLDDNEYAKKRSDAEAELQGLLSIDLPQARHSVSEASSVIVPQSRIAIRQAELNLLEQERNVQMVQQLFENQAESRMNLDSAIAKRDRAKLEVENAREQARAARIKLDKAQQDIHAIGIKARQARQNVGYIDRQIAGLTIRSPLTGVITRKLVNPGVSLAPGSGAATVSDTSHLRVSVSINELEAGKIRVGLPVEVTMDALPGKMFRGRIYQIAPRAALQDRNEGFTAIRILAELDPGTEALRTGNTVRTRIILDRRRKALSLPLEAVRADHQGRKVVFVEKAGKARARPVKVGLSDLRFVEITQGVKPMGLVIVSYGQELKEGSPVAEQRDNKKRAEGAAKRGPHGAFH